MDAPKPCKLGLALSGGTLKAAAHVGVLDALHNMGIQFDCVAGTSAGSFVGALYAHGFQPQDMVRLVDDFPGPRLLDYGFPLLSSMITLTRHRLWPKWPSKAFTLPSGLLQGRRLERYFRKALKGRAYQMPYYAIATDLLTGFPIVYAHPFVRKENPDSVLQPMRGVRAVQPIDDVARVVRGSCSLPGIFTPVVIGPHLIVDGGLRSYVPVEVLRDVGCTHIIAVNLYRLEEEWYPESFAHVLTRSFDILLDETIDADIKGDDVFSIAPDVSHISFVSFGDMKTSVEAGRKAVYERQEEIRQFLNTDTFIGDARTNIGQTKQKRTKDSVSPALKITLR